MWFLSERLDMDVREACFFNGKADCQYILPLLDQNCRKCRLPGSCMEWPLDCPEEIRDIIRRAHEKAKVPARSRTRISQEEFRKQRANWQEILSRHGFDGRVGAGDSFWPLTWQSVTTPYAAIHWPLYFHTIVNEDLANRLTAVHLRNLAIGPVVLDQIGKATAKDLPRIRKIANSDEWIQHVELWERPADCGKYFALRSAQKQRFVDCMQVDFPDLQLYCDLCGCEYREALAHEEMKKYDAKLEAYNRDHVLPRRYFKDVDIFFSHVYPGGYIISDRFRDVLTEDDLKESSLVKVKVVD